MTTTAKVLSPKSYLLRAMVAAVHCKMMKPLLVACMENGPSKLPSMIKMEEEIDSIMGTKITKMDVSSKAKLKKFLSLQLFLGMSFIV